jgi:hypothetical protein
MQSSQNNSRLRYLAGIGNLGMTDTVRSAACPPVTSRRLHGGPLQDSSRLSTQQPLPDASSHRVTRMGSLRESPRADRPLHSMCACGRSNGRSMDSFQVPPDRVLRPSSISSHRKDAIAQTHPLLVGRSAR